MILDIIGKLALTVSILTIVAKLLGVFPYSWWWALAPLGLTIVGYVVIIGAVIYALSKLH